MANNFDGGFNFDPFDFLYPGNGDFFYVWDPVEEEWVPLAEVESVSFEAQFQNHRYLELIQSRNIDQYITNKDRQFLKSMNIIW